MTLKLTNGIQYLEWDSQFFGNKIGKLILNEEVSSNSIKKHGHSASFDLVYVFSNVEQGNDWRPNLMDTRSNSQLVYHHQGLTKTSTIRKLSKIEREEEFLELALLNGLHSRFYLDDKLKPHYEKLYRKWAQKCLNLDTHNTWICEMDDKLVGFVSVSNTDRFQVELSTVHPEYRSQSIARNLWLTAFEEMSIDEPKEFHISFQRSNKIALNFYESLGFKEDERLYVYHLWI